MGAYFVLYPQSRVLTLIPFIWLQVVELPAVILLGFWKSQLITIVNIFGLISLDLPIFKYSLAWYLLATFTVVSTVLWGRLYCGRMCAFGALTQLMDATLPASWRREPPAWLERRASFIKYGILAAAIVYFVVTRDRFVYRYIEPFWMFGFHGSLLMWTMLAVKTRRHRRKWRLRRQGWPPRKNM